METGELDKLYEDMMGDQSSASATMVSLKVALLWPGHGRIVGVTQQMSDFSVTVVVGFDEVPPEDTILVARLMNEAEDAAPPPIIRTRVSKILDVERKIVELEFLG